MTARKESGIVKSWLWALWLLGLGCLVVGVWKVYFDRSIPPPSPVLIVVGALLLAAPVLVDRLGSVVVGPARFELRLVQQIADDGAPKTASLLDHTELGRLAESYGVVHQELRADGDRIARIRIQDALVDRAAAFAGQHTFDPNEVRTLFPVSAWVVRVLLIGLMRGDPRLLSAEVLATAIQQPATNNEQYHSLDVTLRYWTWFKVPEKALLVAAVETISISPEGQTGSGRREKAAAIIALSRRTPPSATAQGPDGATGMTIVEE